jgi:hypothetical protein
VDTDSKYDTVTISVKTDTVDVDDQCYLYIEKNVATLNVNSGAKNAIIGIDYYAKVTEANVDAAIDLYGRGDIGTLYLNASNCTISRGLDISKTTKASGVKGTSYTYNDWYWNDAAYKTYCSTHGAYDYCDWVYWYGDGWCPIHEKWDDGCWYYGYGPDGYWYGAPDGMPPEGFGPGAPGDAPNGMPGMPASVSVSASDGLTYSGTGATIAPNTKLSAVGAVSLTAKDGYDINKLSVTVKMGNTTLTKGTDYDVSSTGVITFKGDKIVSGNISITASIEKKDVTIAIANNAGATVTVNGSNVVDSTSVDYGDGLTVKITASDGTSRLNVTAAPNATVTETYNNQKYSYTVVYSSVTAADTITITSISG